jgi:cell division protease FtsH
MVTQFGMSDAIGPIAVGDREQEIFLGREVTQRREISDSTAQLVDEEVKRILTNAFADAKRILTERRPALDLLAAALLERETLDRDEVELVVAGKTLPPQERPAPLPGSTPTKEKDKAQTARGAGPMLGNPPPEPAGA